MSAISYHNINIAVAVKRNFFLQLASVLHFPWHSMVSDKAFYYTIKNYHNFLYKLFLSPRK